MRSVRPHSVTVAPRRAARASGQGEASGDAFADFDLYTADSNPAKFAFKRPAWLTPVFLGVLALISAALLWGLSVLGPLYRGLLVSVVGEGLSDAAFSLRLRPFFLAFFWTYALFAAGPPLRRLKLLATLTLLFGAVTFALDLLFSALLGPLPPPLVAVFANVAVGFGALVLFAWVLLRQGTLPDDEWVGAVLKRSRRYALRLAFAAVLGGAVAAGSSRYLGGALEGLRGVGLLGGLGPGVVLFFPLFIAILATIETLSLRARGEGARFSVAFLVPALNEADNIAACIRSLDRAAQHYGRVCALYLVDNGSRDLTRALAEAELKRCRALQGRVLVCREPGKSKALNAGLQHIEEDLVVRVDADTQVAPTLLTQTALHFAEPAVGAVSGLPLPSGAGTLIGKLRAAEVYLNQGFVRLGMGAIDGVLSMTGVFSAYRRSCLDRVGGFAEGINGEDTDIVLRIGRLGYRLVNDPRIHVFSEVPGSLAALREQRLRWFRSTFHVAARNRSAMWRRQGVRGVFSLPWALVQTVRRSLVVPVLVYAGVVALLEPSALFLRGGAAALAVLVGLPFLVSVGVLLAYRRFDLLLFTPAYVFFRLLRAYFSLEMLLTLPLGRTPLPQPRSSAGPLETGRQLPRSRRLPRRR